jgi:CDP-glycerol glycerophosphotransferase (TagB/SpsB family)
LSLKGLWTALRAGVYVFDFRSSDISYALSGGATRVNLWHGIPLKRIERDIEDPQHPLNKARHGSLPARVVYSWVDPQIYEHADFIVATGPDPARFFQTAFAMRQDQVLLTGYPRNDALFRDEWTTTASSAIDRSINRQLQRDREEGIKVIGYFPTWRDVTMVKGSWFQVPLPVEQLERVLAEHNAKLYCKLHQSSRAVLDGADACKHIEMLPSQVDIYQQLPLMDALITDYSSVYFDYLLLDRPIIFYAPDLDAYRRYRTFYYEYDNATPGPKTFSEDELVCTLKNLLSDYDRAVSEWASQRERVRQLVHSFTDGHSAKRCMTEIIARIGNGPSPTSQNGHA